MTTTTKVELPVAYVKYIRSIPMFSALTEEELGNIIKADDCIERTCSPRFKIIREGEVGDLYVCITSRTCSRSGTAKCNLS